MTEDTGAGRPKPKGETTSAVHFSNAALDLLKRVAFARHMNDRKRYPRASVSVVINELVEQHREELEREISR